MHPLGIQSMKIDWIPKPQFLFFKYGIKKNTYNVRGVTFVLLELKNGGILRLYFATVKYH